MAASDRFQPTTRTARQDGRDVVRLTAVDRGHGVVVEAEVLPAAGRAAEPVRRPYFFATAHEADAFVEESLRALAYLGCEIE